MQRLFLLYSVMPIETDDLFLKTGSLSVQKYNRKENLAFFFFCSPFAIFSEICRLSIK